VRKGLSVVVVVIECVAPILQRIVFRVVMVDLMEILVAWRWVVESWEVFHQNQQASKGEWTWTVAVVMIVIVTMTMILVVVVPGNYYCCRPERKRMPISPTWEMTVAMVVFAEMTIHWNVLSHDPIHPYWKHGREPS
jgi:hypothetical protein